MARALRRFVPAALLLAACSDAPTVPLDLGAIEPPALDIFFPTFDPEMLIQYEEGNGTEPASAPLRISEGEEPPPLGEGTEVPPDAVAGIYSPYTFAYFNSDHAYAQGEHRYQGNKSRIETTLDVWFEGQRIASQLGVKEESDPFAFSLFVTRYIQAVSRVFTDQKCGLSATASSQHSAWWEAVMGSPVSRFGTVATSSYATRRSQPECPPPTIIQSGGGGGNGSGGAVCWVSIWYDLATGEIVDYDVLWCESYGG